VRHKVEAGETAYSIARRYNVPVKALAEWNGLGGDFTVRTGQFLLIPVAEPGATVAAAPAPVPKPGQGSVAPVPPSAATALPDPAEATPDAAAEITPESPDLAAETTTAAASDARMVYPVGGKIVRAYQKGKNDGIDISVAAGTPVRAADSGVVAAITRDVDQVPILVLRHADNVLTVYAGVDQIAVNKGDQVRRGQEIARVRASASPLLHFEVREGFDSVDPALYLE
jgi:murein DD-endopeptidase MepM/ murein hydrolase activator NlpD